MLINVEIPKCLKFQIPPLRLVETGTIIYALFSTKHLLGASQWLSGKESTYNAGHTGSIPGSGRSPGEVKMETHSSILAWRIPSTEDAGGLYSPWGCKKSDTTEQLTHTHKSKRSI